LTAPAKIPKGVSAMRNLKTKNHYQKAACKTGEPRVNAPEVASLLQLAKSDRADDRLLAAQFMCPCHVRKRIDDVWEALFKLMEDPDLKVRRAAWHTLEDGGGGDNPRVQAIADRVWQTETDPKIRHFIEHFTGGSPLQRQRLSDRVATFETPRTRGKCDFCGATNTWVRDEYDTSIPDGTSTRAARMCKLCER
jgi:hypothetical protein